MAEQTTGAADSRNLEEKVASELHLDIEIVKAAKISEGDLTTFFNEVRDTRGVKISLAVFLIGAGTMFSPLSSSMFVFTAGVLTLVGGLFSAIGFAGKPEFLRDEISNNALAGQCKAYNENKAADAPSAAPS